MLRKQKRSKVTPRWKWAGSWPRSCYLHDVLERKNSLSDQLEERLIGFAAEIVTFSAELIGTPAGKHIATQMLRSGTAPAPNYAEARGAESRADFIHKLGIVQKELNETSVWLRILMRINLGKEDLLVARENHYKVDHDCKEAE